MTQTNYNSDLCLYLNIKTTTIKQRLLQMSFDYLITCISDLERKLIGTQGNDFIAA